MLWFRVFFSTLFAALVAAGYYLCWGCMVWVPCIYTSPAMYLVHHPVNLGAPVRALPKIIIEQNQRNS